MANILNKMGGQRLKQRLQEMEIYFENKFIIGPQKLQQIWTPTGYFLSFFISLKNDIPEYKNILQIWVAPHQLKY